MKRMIKTIGLSLLLIASASYATAIKTIKPWHGTIQKSFTEPARTYLENTYDINMPIAGKLARIKVREGVTVTAGETVAKLAQEPLQQTVNKAKAYLHTIKLLYALQTKTVARYQSLAKKGFIQIAALDEAVAREKASLAQITQAQAELAIANYNQQISVLHSPIAGTVLNRYNQGGKWLQVGTPLLRIGDLSQLEVICDVLTQEAQELQLGDQVLLTSIGSPTVIHGTLKQIYPAGFTKKSSLGVDEQRVNVIISIKNLQQTKLGLGYRLQAKFLVGARRKQALIIPRFSILQDPSGDYYVFVVKAKKLHKQVVKLGIMTDTQVAITSGLTTTDNIVDQPTADMHSGQRI